MKRLAFYFLHLLGVGHVHRARRLIEGFAREGIVVDVIHGGHDIGVTFEAESVFHLPPIAAADASYASYVDGTGAPLSEAWMEKRRALLVGHVNTLKPDAVLVEAWPFGRRIVSDEIVSMLDAVGPKEPLVVTSVRDILQPRKKGRAEETKALLDAHVDRVLVHSDPALIPLEATYPLASSIADKLAYTGFVVPQIDLGAQAETFDVIVTCGGGGFGAALLEAALGIALQRPDWRFCLAHGPHMQAVDVAELRAIAPGNVVLVERLENLAAHLVKARLSISQCGYNTAMDALAARGAGGAAIVFVPYDMQGQVEQSARADLLAGKGLAISLPQSRCDEAALLAACDAALRLPSATIDIDFDGVAKSARLLRGWMEERA